MLGFEEGKSLLEKGLHLGVERSMLLGRNRELLGPGLAVLWWRTLFQGFGEGCCKERHGLLLPQQQDQFHLQRLAAEVFSRDA